MDLCGLTLCLRAAVVGFSTPAPPHASCPFAMPDRRSSAPPRHRSPRRHRSRTPSRPRWRHGALQETMPQLEDIQTIHFGIMRASFGDDDVQQLIELCDEFDIDTSKGMGQLSSTKQRKLYDIVNSISKSHWCVYKPSKKHDALVFMQTVEPAKRLRLFQKQPPLLLL